MLHQLEVLRLPPIKPFDKTVFGIGNQIEIGFEFQIEILNQIEIDIEFGSTNRIESQERKRRYPIESDRIYDNLLSCGQAV